MSVVKKKVTSSNGLPDLEIELDLNLSGNKPCYTRYDSLINNNSVTEFIYECFAPIHDANTSYDYWKIKRTENHYIDGKIEESRVLFPYGDSSYSYRPSEMIDGGPDGSWLWSFGIDLD
jgi:hypothetical protein